MCQWWVDISLRYAFDERYLPSLLMSNANVFDIQFQYNVTVLLERVDLLNFIRLF